MLFTQESLLLQANFARRNQDQALISDGDFSASEKRTGLWKRVLLLGMFLFVLSACADDKESPKKNVAEAGSSAPTDIVTDELDVSDSQMAAEASLADVAKETYRLHTLAKGEYLTAVLKNAGFADYMNYIKYVEYHNSQVAVVGGDALPIIDADVLPVGFILILPPVSLDTPVAAQTVPQGSAAGVADQELSPKQRYEQNMSSLLALAWEQPSAFIDWYLSNEGRFPISDAVLGSGELAILYTTFLSETATAVK